MLMLMRIEILSEEYAVDLTEHKAQPVSKDLVDWSDLILVMEKSHQDSFFTQFPEAADKTMLIRHYARYGSRNRGIADPHGLDSDFLRVSQITIFPTFHLPRLRQKPKKSRLKLRQRAKESRPRPRQRVR